MIYRVRNNLRNRFASAAKVVQQAEKTSETRHKSLITVGRITRYVWNDHPMPAKAVHTTLRQSNRCDAVSWCRYGWLHTLLRSLCSLCEPSVVYQFISYHSLSRWFQSISPCDTLSHMAESGKCSWKSLKICT